MKIFERLEKAQGIWFLIATSLVFFLLRLPSLFEPNWYGDEGVYQVLGMGIRAGRLLYRDIFDNKPPLLYLFYGLVNSDEFLIRLLSLIFGLLSVIAFFYLSKKLFDNLKVSYISTFLFAVLFGLPLIEGDIANAENFMLLLNILAGYFVLKSLEINDSKKKYKVLLFAGLILGLSFLFKIIAIFDFAAFLGFLFFANYSKRLLEIFRIKNLANEIRSIAPFIITFLVPILLVAIFFILKGAFPQFMAAVLFNNVGYVGYGNQFIIPQGFLIFKLILLGTFCLFIFYKRKVYGNPFVFVSLWLIFSLFSAFFSQRPYTHYVLVIVPAFCLTLGLFLQNKNFSKLAGVLMLSTLILVLLGFNLYFKTGLYYQNFISFVFDSKKVTAYRGFFDSATPRDYELASFIKMNTNASDNIFIWGNNAQVYQLTNKLPPGKYTVAYHIQNYKDGLSNTQKRLAEKKPKLIIVMPNVSEYPFSLSNYNFQVDLDNVRIYEKLY